MSYIPGIKEDAEPRSPEELLLKALVALPGNTWDLKFKVCTDCECCIRHKFNRPSKIQILEEDPNINYEKSNECKCTCRHMARWICRSAIRDIKNGKLIFNVCPTNLTKIEEDKI